MWAAATGECDVVTELISLGADVDIQTNVVSHFLSHHDTTKWFRTTECVRVQFAGLVAERLSMGQLIPRVPSQK